MLRFPVNLFRACAIACLAACICAGECLRAADTVYEVATQGNVMVLLRDGVRLATDVYLPARDGKPLDERLPTILMRTPYGKSGLKEGAPANSRPVNY